MSARVRGPKARALLEKRRMEKEAAAQGEKVTESVQAATTESGALQAGEKAGPMGSPLAAAGTPGRESGAGELAGAVRKPAPGATPPPAAPPPPPAAAAVVAADQGERTRAEQKPDTSALMKDIQSARPKSIRTTAAAELAKASHRPEAFREAGEAVAASLVAAESAGRTAQLGPGLRVAQALLEAMASGATASTATQLALDAEPYDLAEQLQRVEALRRKEAGAVLAPRFGDTLAPAQVRADRALALLGRLRDELSTPPVPAPPKRPLLNSTSRAEESDSPIFTRTPATDRFLSAAAPPPPVVQAPDLSAWGAEDDRGGLDLGGIKQAALIRDIQKAGGSSSRIFEEPRVNSREQMLLDIQRAGARRQPSAASESQESNTSSREQMLLDIQQIGAQASGRHTGTSESSGRTVRPPPLPSRSGRRVSGRGGSPAGSPTPPPQAVVPVQDLSGWGSDTGIEGESLQSRESGGSSIFSR